MDKGRLYDCMSVMYICTMNVILFCTQSCRNSPASKTENPLISTSLTLTCSPARNSHYSFPNYSIRSDSICDIRIPIWITKQPNTMMFLTRFSQPLRVTLPEVINCLCLCLSAMSTAREKERLSLSRLLKGKEKDNKPAPAGFSTTSSSQPADAQSNTANVPNEAGSPSWTGKPTFTLALNVHMDLVDLEIETIRIGPVFPGKSTNKCIAKTQ
jgi:hypothetical protein